MRHIDRLGQELVYAIRRRNERRELYQAAADEVSLLEAEIARASQEELHASTGSFPAVPDDRPTQVMQIPQGWECPGQGYCARAGTQHVHLESGQIWSTE